MKMEARFHGGAEVNSHVGSFVDGLYNPRIPKKAQIVSNEIPLLRDDETILHSINSI